MNTRKYGGGAWILLISALVRLAALGWLELAEVQPLYDEASYVRQAEGWREWASDPTTASFSKAVLEGDFPPLHSMFLALVSVPWGRTGARFALLLLSVATTGMILRIGTRLGGRRAGMVSGVLHALSPRFVFFAVTFWAETTFLFLGLAAVGRLLAEDENDQGGASFVLPGLLLGAATLTRSVGLAWILGGAVWLAATRRGRRARFRSVAGLTIGALLLILPWQTVLSSQAGRLIGATRSAGWNWALGNHADIPTGLGSSWGHEPSKNILRERLMARGAKNDVAWRDVAGQEAFEEIVRRPQAAAVRTALRARELLSPDVFPLRHLARATLPPLPGPLLICSILLSLLETSFLLTLVVFGLGALWGRGRPASPESPSREIDPRAGRLLVVLTGASVLPPLMTISMSRLALPAVACLLPVAAIGLVHRGGRGLRVAAVVLVLISLSNLPTTIGLHLQPSSWYQASLAPFERLAPGMVTNDRLLFRRAGSGPLPTVHPLTTGSRVLPVDPAGRVVDVESPIGSGPLELELKDPVTGSRVCLRPLVREGWQEWRATGLDGIDVRWAGGGEPSRLEGSCVRPGAGAQVSSVRGGTSTVCTAATKNR